MSKFSFYYFYFNFNIALKKKQDMRVNYIWSIITRNMEIIRMQLVHGKEPTR